MNKVRIHRNNFGITHSSNLLSDIMIETEIELNVYEPIARLFQQNEETTKTNAAILGSSFEMYELLKSLSPSTDIPLKYRKQISSLLTKIKDFEVPDETATDEPQPSEPVGCGKKLAGGAYYCGMEIGDNRRRPRTVVGCPTCRDGEKMDEVEEVS